MDAVANVAKPVPAAVPDRSAPPATKGKLPTGRLAAHALLHTAVTGVQLPIGVYLPAIYAQQYGISLTVLGMIFLVERIWGTATDPDGDCQFFVADETLLISVPGTQSHDLAADIETVNAPRVLQSVRGDFVVQARVDGRFAPGGQTTKPGRASTI